MPDESVSLYFTLRDGASAVLKTIGDKTKVLDKETQRLTQAYSALGEANKPLIERQNELKMKLEDSRKTITDLRSEVRKYGDETSRDSLAKAIREQDEYRQELKDVEDQLRANQKTQREYREEVRKGLSAAGMSGGSGSESSMLSSLAGAGVFKELGSAASEIAGLLVVSAGGSEVTSIFSSALGSAGSGAAIGSMILPGLGTAIGAAVGGLVGAATGAAQNWAKKDEAFIAYYNDLYENAGSAASETVTSGSGIAGSREQVRFAFARRFGSDKASEDYMERIRQFAIQTNYSYDDLVDYAKQLLVSYDRDETFRVMQALSDATAGLNLDSGDNQQLISVLGQLQLAPSVTQEYLRQFRDRGVDVNTALGDYLGVDPSAITKMVSAGKISGTDAAEAMLQYIEREYGGLSADLMGTFEALTDNLEDYEADLQNAAGEAYNELRKESLTAQADAYDGPLGQAMTELARVTGENQAYMENLSDQYKREALAAVLLGDEVSDIWNTEAQGILTDLHDRYAEAKAAYEAGDRDAGLRMQSIKEQAESTAQAAYDANDAVKTQTDVQKDLIEATRDLAAAFDGWKNAYELGKEGEKGQAATAETPWVLEGFTGLSGYATGLDRVPYDNFPALLHRDEQVLTASEARSRERGGVTIIMNGVTIREEADIDRVAGELWSRLQLARMRG